MNAKFYLFICTSILHMNQIYQILESILDVIEFLNRVVSLKTKKSNVGLKVLYFE